MRSARMGSIAALCPLVACGILGMVRADACGVDRPASADHPPLAGRYLTVRDALDRSHLVVVATVERLGFGGELHFTKNHYVGAKARVRLTLKGSARGDLEFDFALRLADPRRPEEAPKAGGEYLIFLDKPAREGGSAGTIKMLHPTRAALETVEALLKEKPLPGSDLGEREAAASADLVAMARVIRLDRGGPPAPEGSHYHAKVKITGRLKGGDVTSDFVYFPVGFAPNGDAERVPAEGAEYVFFIRKRPGEGMVAIKITPPGRETIRIIQESDYDKISND